MMNVTWFVWKIGNHLIGRGNITCPGTSPKTEESTRWKTIKTRVNHIRTTCFFFGCLALHNDCHTKNLKRDSKHYYQQYREAGLVKKKFNGVKLSELDELEKLYEVNIQVYNLAPTQTNGEDKDDAEEETRPDIATTLICRSHCHYESTLFLNLYENHFFVHNRSRPV